MDTPCSFLNSLGLPRSFLSLSSAYIIILHAASLTFAPGIIRLIAMAARRRSPGISVLIKTLSAHVWWTVLPIEVVTAERGAQLSTTLLRPLVHSFNVLPLDHAHSLSLLLLLLILLLSLYFSAAVDLVIITLNLIDLSWVCTLLKDLRIRVWLQITLQLIQLGKLRCSHIIFFILTVDNDVILWFFIDTFIKHGSFTVLITTRIAARWLALKVGIMPHNLWYLQFPYLRVRNHFQRIFDL